MIDAVSRALGEIFTPPFRSVMLKSLGAALLVLVLGYLALQSGAAWLIDLPGPAWIDTALGILLGLGMVFGMMFLIAPFTTLFAGFFADEIAAVVERVDYPADPPGREMPIMRSLATAVRFTLVVIGVNLMLLFLIFLPGIGVAAVFAANGYLLGREFFEMAAMRHMPAVEARAFRRANRLTVWAGGLAVALFMAVPLLNLMTPLFATATMMHLFKRLAGVGAGGTVRLP